MRWPLAAVALAQGEAEDFLSCLRRRGRWSEADAALVIAGYRRFLYLKASTGETLAPPESVDMAWHLHIEQEADWSAFEEEPGCRILHVENLEWPGNGESYLRTYALYQSTFGERPSSVIWLDPGGLARLLQGRRFAQGLFLLGIVCLFSLGAWPVDVVNAVLVLGIASIGSAIALLSLSRHGPPEIAECG